MLVTGVSSKKKLQITLFSEKKEKISFSSMDDVARGQMTPLNEYLKMRHCVTLFPTAIITANFSASLNEYGL